MTKWTHFWDMYSGGRTKEPYEHIFIEAPREEAEVIFYNRFGHNPNRVTCTCCGEDYSIDEGESLEKLTKYHREDSFSRKKKLNLEEYLALDEVKVIYASEIEDSERKGDLPTQGYVWH